MQLMFFFSFFFSLFLCRMQNELAAALNPYLALGLTADNNE
jgi:hypothetical protein